MFSTWLEDFNVLLAGFLPFFGSQVVLEGYLAVAMDGEGYFRDYPVAARASGLEPWLASILARLAPMARDGDTLALASGIISFILHLVWFG